MKRVVIALVLACLPFAGAAQEPAVPPVPQGPILRASVDQVVVDVVVTDADGQAVTGLTAADFEIRERGAAQSVATFSEVSLPVVRRAPGTLPPPPGDVRSNVRANDARVYVLVLDDVNVVLHLTPVVQRAAREFVHRYVQAGDLVAVLTTSGLGVTRQEPTEDVALVDAAIARFAGYGGDYVSTASRSKVAQAYATRNADPMTTQRRSTTLMDDGSVADNDDATDEGRQRALLTLRTLENVATSLAGVSGRRKAIVFFSQGAPIAMRDGEFLDAHSRVLGAAARANATIYALDPNGLDHPTAFDARGLTQPAGSLDPALQHSRDLNAAVNGVVVQRRIMAAAMLRTLAEGTGGVASVDRTNLDPALDRIAADSSHYYLLGYVPADAKREGRYRGIEVRLKRPDLHVSARKGYVEADDKAKRKTDPKGAVQGPLAEMIRLPVASAGLSFSVHAVALPGASRNVSVVVEVAPDALTFEARGDQRVTTVDLAIVPVGPGGQVFPAVDGHANLTLPAAEADVIAARGVRMVHRLTLAPGRYQLRVGARETTRQRTGSVIYDLTVPEAKAGLALSGLILSSTLAGRIPTSERDEAIEQALGGRPPTTSRVFATDDVLSVYAEAIDAGATAARDVEMTTILRDGRGRELLRNPQAGANRSVAPGKSFAYAIDLPLKALAPGRYTLRVEARTEGTREPIARDVAFDVRTPNP
ncbi:MAG: VWA domain-containing protein [Vicinamibacteraceae bacterium]